MRMRLPAIVAFITCFSAFVSGGALIHNQALKNSFMAGEQLQDTGTTFKRSLERRFDNVQLIFDDFETGVPAACGESFSNNDFVVALNLAQFQVDSHCFQKINITAEGKSTIAEIVDGCPFCTEFGLDLTPGLFQFFAPLPDGLIVGSWDFVDTSVSV
ncbi:hypothetical protein CPC08DRAFT_755507 [Agrocybe pediades]|nr:hypothetical protein CPC08DRAFT_755507 [Agrocybe pediades]